MNEITCSVEHNANGKQVGKVEKIQIAQWKYRNWVQYVLFTGDFEMEYFSALLRK